MSAEEKHICFCGPCSVENERLKAELAQANKEWLTEKQMHLRIETQLREQIAALESQLSEVLHDKNEYNLTIEILKTERDNLEKEVEALSQQLAAAREALQLHGKHLDGCRRIRFDWSAKCDCGLEKALSLPLHRTLPMIHR